MNWRRLIPSRNIMPMLATIIVYIVMFLVTSHYFPTFRTLRNTMSILQSNAGLGVIAVGSTLVILAEGIDLSVGAMIGLTSTFTAWEIMNLHLSPLAAWPLVLLGGAIFGGTMGVLIHAFELPAFLVTLGGMFFARGMAFVVNPEQIIIHHDIYDKVYQLNRVVPLTDDGVFLKAQVVIFFLILLLGIYLAGYTRFGRAIYAIGGNENSAVLMGLPVARTKIMIYAFSGLCAALAGAMYTIDTGKGYPAAGDGFELNAIAAVVIGGTLLTGGQGYVFGTLVGLMIFGSINVIIGYNPHSNSSIQPITVGVLLLGFILLQKFVSSLHHGTTPEVVADEASGRQH